MIVPRLTPAQRRLLDSLQPTGRERWHRYSTVGRQRGSGLTSCLALWRRGYIATNEDGCPDALESGERGLVNLTALGEQLLAHIRKAS